MVRPDPSLYRDLYPFESHFLEVPGGKLHYVDEGSGDVILFIHGNPTWSFYYRRLISAFSTTYRTISPDHIGCGLSDKPSPDQYEYTLARRLEDIEALVVHLNITGKITLVLHDWGGMIGMAYAVRHPELISRIILTNTAAFLPPQGKPLPLRLQLVRNLKFLSKPAVLGLNLFAEAALYMAPRKPLSKKVKNGLIAPYNSWSNRIATLLFVYDIPIGPEDPSFQMVQDVDHQLTRLQHLPMLICWGKHDFVFDLDYFNEWQRRFPKAEAHLYQNAGHYLLEDEPESVACVISDFLTSTQ
jgi:cis-3-alkyl-4-acyloxetan-2-one decarboxylase